MAKSTDEFIKENVPRGTSSPKTRGVSSLKGYGEGEEAADIRRSAREALRGLVGLEPFDPTNPSEAYRIASTPTPLVAIGAGIRGAKKVIGSEEAAKAIGKAAEAAGMKAPTTAAKSLTTLDDFHLSLGDAIRKRSADMQDLIESTPFKYSIGDRVFTADSARKNRPPLEILNRVMVGNDPMREGHPILGKVIKDPETGKTKRTPYEPGYEVLVFEDKDNWSKFRIPESAIKGMIDPTDPLEKQDGGEATVEEFISQNMGGGERKQNIKLDSVQDLKDFLQKLPKDLPVKPVEPEEVLPDVALKRKGARELESYINALNPRAQVFDVLEGYQTNYRSTPFSQSGTVGSVPIREPDRINVLKTLTPGQRERVLLHEAEHSMSLRGGDILGELDSKGRPILMDNAYRAVALLKGNERPVREFVKNVALNKDKIDAFFGEPSFGTEFKKQSYEELKGRGKELALFEEQLASLSALEQATGKFLTQDKEMRKLLFPNTEMMAIFDALTGPRQTRMDARDLPPHTPINPMAYDTGNAVSQFIKEKTREPLLRELPKAKMRVK